MKTPHCCGVFNLHGGAMVTGWAQQLSRSLEAGVAFLVTRRTPEGGWPYALGQSCYVEPTALAILALGPEETGIQSAVDPTGSFGAARAGLFWIASQTRQDGAVVLPDDPGTPTWSTGLAVYAAARVGGASGAWRAGARFLLGWWAAAAEYDPMFPSDTELRGWPWYPGSSGWVIPTAHAVLALRLVGYGQHARVTDGEALLLDRMCAGGGWNYGIREMMGQSLRPMADTTAWALLALQRRPDAGEAVALGLRILNQEVQSHPTSLSLAQTLLCFDLFGHPCDGLVPLLVERQMDDGSWGHQVHLTALALLALKACLGVGNAFAL